MILNYLVINQFRAIKPQWKEIKLASSRFPCKNFKNHFDFQYNSVQSLHKQRSFFHFNHKICFSTENDEIIRKKWKKSNQFSHLKSPKFNDMEYINTESKSKWRGNVNSAEIFDRNLCELSMSQNGSLEMQSIIDSANQMKLALILEELSPHFVELSFNSYGRDVVQKLMKKCNQPLHYEIVSNALKGKIAQLFKSEHSGAVIQYLLHFPSKYFNYIVEEVLPHSRELSVDLNGHVYMQAIIEKLNRDQFPKLLKELSSHLIDLSTNSLGHLVIQNLMEKCMKPLHFEIVSEGLKGSAIQLFRYEHSHRTIRYLSEFPTEYLNDVVNELLPHIKELSMEKNGQEYLSSMVENLNQNQLANITEIISPHFFALSTHRYGHVVVQKLIESTISSHQVSIIKDLLSKFYEELKRDEYGTLVLESYLRSNPSIPDTSKVETIDIWNQGK
eukprot:TRINITY_DN5909_c0_g1_i1.p1 TRINITY_DN5909_c0_g1~~TRINITY_DN5909_c0_g1_i1.p1  ORF type:complete len:445 (+),score=106.92 TRINITY_DN5909_c0_g1_i1:3-1337(+)